MIKRLHVMVPVSSSNLDSCNKILEPDYLPEQFTRHVIINFSSAFLLFSFRVHVAMSCFPSKLSAAVNSAHSAKAVRTA